MELISLLNQKNWESSSRLEKDEIKKAIQMRVSDNVTKLYRSYQRGLWLNLFFLLSFGSVYWFNRSPEFLVPLVLIVACFAFTVLNVLFHLIYEDRVNLSRDLKTVLIQTLDLDKKLYARQCKYNRAIILVSFIGGFFLGLAYQGWTFSKYLEKPVIFPVFLVLFMGFYALIKSSSFSKINRWFNPGYYKAKSFLEHQLELISSDD